MFGLIQKAGFLLVQWFNYSNKGSLMTTSHVSLLCKPCDTFSIIKESSAVSASRYHLSLLSLLSCFLSGIVKTATALWLTNSRCHFDFTCSMENGDSCLILKSIHVWHLHLAPKKIRSYFKYFPFIFSKCHSQFMCSELSCSDKQKHQ